LLGGQTRLPPSIANVLRVAPPPGSKVPMTLLYTVYGSMGCFLLNVSLQNEHPLMESAFMSGRQTPEHSELPPLSELAGVQIGYKAQRAGTILTLRHLSVLVKERRAEAAARSALRLVVLAQCWCPRGNVK
jgi:hypothetical protein